MKKVILLLSLFMLGILLAIIIFSINRTSIETVKYYSVRRSYSYQYQENKKMCLELYSNQQDSSIEFPDKNSYSLKHNSSTYLLQNIEIKSGHTMQYEKNQIHKIFLYADLIKPTLDHFILNDFSLLVQNETFTLELPIGFLAIYQEHIPKLQFQELFGHYSYIEDELHLVGITILLPNVRKSLQDLRIGAGEGALEFIEEDTLYDSELPYSTLKHKIVKDTLKQESHMLSAKKGYYFIPISYETLILISQGAILLILDNQIYCIEEFCFLANDILLSDYVALKQEGKIIYA